MSLDERIEDLQCQGLKIIQNKKLYTFTSDSVVLANYAKTKAKDIVVEIGAGSGVISILLQAKNKLNKIYAFEIQPQMQDLCEKNIKLNNLQDKIVLIRDDVNNFKQHIAPASVDTIVSNPPYFKKTDFKQDKVKQIAKEEVCLTAEQLVSVAGKMLKDGGAFWCCFPAERSCELISLCQNNALAVKEMFFTENGKGEVKLFVCKAVKNGKFGTKVLPNLITNETNGNYLEKLHTKNIK